MADDLDSMFGETLAGATALPNGIPAQALTRPSDDDLWRNLSLCAVFTRVTCCNCGCSSIIPEGFFVHRRHARNGAEHFQLVHFAAEAYPELPRLLHFNDRDSAFCFACISTDFV